MASYTFSTQEKQTSSQSSAEVAECLQYLSADQLHNLTVDQLVTLYLRFPERVEPRISAGREHFTRFFETRIISELSTRTPADSTERSKIDSCLSSHRAEMDNMAAVLGLPLTPATPSASPDILAPDPTRHYTPDELIALLHLYTPCRDLTERERLVEYVDYSLNLLASSSDHQPLANLVAELAELDRRHIVRCPHWLHTLLTDTITAWLTSPVVPDTDMVLPLLTASLLNLTVTPPHRRPIPPPSLERRAQRIINRCYRTSLSLPCSSHSLTPAYLSDLITTLYIAATYSSYVTRFSSRRLALAWNTLAAYFLYIPNYTTIESCLSKDSIDSVDESSSLKSYLSTSQLIYLLLVADELNSFVPVTYSLHRHLFTSLEKKSASDNLRSIIYFRNLESDNPSLATAV